MISILHDSLCCIKVLSIYILVYINKDRVRVVINIEIKLK